MRPGLWIVAAIVVLAAARGFELGTWGLWIDEVHTLHDARELRWGKLTDFPLNLLVMERIIAWSGPGPSEFALRLWPALMGVAGIAVAYFGFRRPFGEHRARITALLVGLSAWHLYWSQCARHYTMAQTLSLCGGALVLSGALDGIPRRFLLGLAVASAAALAHPSAAFLVPALLLAPWLSARLGAAPKWSPPTSWVLAAGLVGALVGLKWGGGVWAEYASKKSGASVMHFVSSTAFYVGPALACAAAWSAFDAWRRRAPGDVIAALIGLLVLGSATLAALFVKVAAQYVFVVLPWVAVLGSALVLPETKRRWPVHVIGAAVLAWGAVDLGLYFTARHGDRPRWKEAYAFVARHRGPDDLVAGMALPVAEYYLGPANTKPREPLDVARLTLYDRRLFDDWVRRERRLWLVINREELTEWGRDDRERVERFLSEHCQRVAAFPVTWTPRSLEIEVYVR